jgi:hypothetical protein
MLVRNDEEATETKPVAPVAAAVVASSAVARRIGVIVKEATEG